MLHGKAGSRIAASIVPFKNPGARTCLSEREIRIYIDTAFGDPFRIILYPHGSMRMDPFIIRPHQNICHDPGVLLVHTGTGKFPDH